MICGPDPLSELSKQRGDCIACEYITSWPPPTCDADIRLPPLIYPFRPGFLGTIPLPRYLHAALGTSPTQLCLRRVSPVTARDNSPSTRRTSSDTAETRLIVRLVVCRTSFSSSVNYPPFGYMPENEPNTSSASVAWCKASVELPRHKFPPSPKDIPANLTY